MNIKRQLISGGLIAALVIGSASINLFKAQGSDTPCYTLSSISSTGTKSCHCYNDPVSGMGVCPMGSYTDAGKLCNGGNSNGWKECDNARTEVGKKFSCSRSLNWANLMTCIGGGAGIGVIIGGPIGAGVGGGLAFVTCIGCTVTTCSKLGKGTPINRVRAVYWGRSGCSKSNSAG